MACVGLSVAVAGPFLLLFIEFRLADRGSEVAMSLLVLAGAARAALVFGDALDGEVRRVGVAEVGAAPEAKSERGQISGYC